MTTSASGWRRVTRKEKCPQCKHDSWCCIGRDFVNCMRIESPKAAKNGGWLHKIGDAVAGPVRPIPTTPEPPRPNCTLIMRAWRERTSHDWITALGYKLGVSALSLEALDAAWSAEHAAWAFPMRDGYRNIIGIRLRNDDGKKWAVTGSRAGLFIPTNETGDDLYLTEGPTDCAAAITIGLWSIGRPSCLGCESMVNDFVRENQVRRVVIVADHDEPGQRGAEKLQASLRVPSKIWTPSAKDMRASVASGMTAAMVSACVKDLRWEKER